MDTEQSPRRVDPPALTSEEVAEALSVRRHTVDRLIKDGSLLTVRIGQLRQMCKVDLERWMGEHLSLAS